MRFVLPVVIVLVAVGWLVFAWAAKSPALASRGGLWFPRAVLLDTPHFSQADPRWGRDFLGSTPATLGEEGCAVASAAMALGFYGADVDPGRLNAFLRTHDGYAGRGWIRWEKAAEYPPAVAEHVYEDDASHFLMDWNLLRGNPVIVRIRHPNGVTHFVLVVGKSGFEYLVRDPGAGFSGKIRRLSDFGSPIEALRFYRRLSGGG